MLMGYLRLCGCNYDAKFTETNGAKPESEPELDIDHPILPLPIFFYKRESARCPLAEQSLFDFGQ